MEHWQLYTILAAIYMQSLIGEKIRAITAAGFLVLACLYSSIELLKLIKG